MTDEPFGRQPDPVTMVFGGDPKDVEDCMRRVFACIKNNFWQVEHRNNMFIFYPRAVND